MGREIWLMTPWADSRRKPVTFAQILMTRFKTKPSIILFKTINWFTPWFAPGSRRWVTLDLREINLFDSWHRQCVIGVYEYLPETPATPEDFICQSDRLKSTSGLITARSRIHMASGVLHYYCKASGNPHQANLKVAVIFPWKLARPAQGTSESCLIYLVCVLFINRTIKCIAQLTISAFFWTH